MSRRLPSWIHRAAVATMRAERMPAERVPAERVPAERVPAERVPARLAGERVRVRDGTISPHEG